jgi:hypothetical protein
VKRKLVLRLRRDEGRLAVPVFDLLHEGFALEEEAIEICAELAWDDEKLVVDDIAKIHRSTGGGEMRSPLEHEAGIPNDEQSDQGVGSGECQPGRRKSGGNSVEENGETDDEERSQRNEKSIAVGRDAGPIRVTRNEEIEAQERSEEGDADARFPAPENEKTKDGESHDGRPEKKAMV